LNLPSGYEQPGIPMSTGTVEKLFEPRRVLFHPTDATSQPITYLNNQNIQHLRLALVSTKEAFAYFCLLTKVCRSQSAALRNKGLQSAVDALTLVLNSLNQKPFTRKSFYTTNIMWQILPHLLPLYNISFSKLNSRVIFCPGCATATLPSILGLYFHFASALRAAFANTPLGF
jgi:hypothetical protein